MINPFNRSSFVCTGIVYLLLSSSALAQDDNIPRTPYGHPDLQGNWINDVQAPLVRPEVLGEQQAYTEAEVRTLLTTRTEQQRMRERASDPNRPAPPIGDTITNIADGNFLPEMPLSPPYVNGEYRTSLIIDPPNGRVPLIDGARDYYAQLQAQGFGQFDGPEIRPANERCLNSPGQLPLVIQIPPGDSKTMQIIQTRDYVVLNAEYATSIRIVPLHLDENPIAWPQWRGVSLGRWEGDTLVVRTRQFRPEQTRPKVPSSAQLETVEEFTLTSADELLYRFRFSDPVTIDGSFTGELPLSRMPAGQRLYESACHEGNYSLPGVLAGARRAEIEQELQTSP
ncbi:MAG: hypothetical protein PsegKO_30760 [Pseudohongiellaceae bacterium]